ncbi:MAG TPA: 16S rRNA (guanine(527)-N(7))-methyltransferase RsmG [Candidatus Acidoferrum sp.]|nr:16S rRNA (guanine(527)-N(7))-methyltransferase RsmG [Candidatus Acidoferrum sp.]
MRPPRIAELLRRFLEDANSTPFSESGSLYERISTYIDILVRWNARINLTAIRDPEEIVTRHFGESLFVARHLFPSVSSVSPVPSVVKGFVPATDRLTSRTRVADFGSGAGFPGLPIKLWAPEIVLTLIESHQKKAVFLREVTRALTLTDVNIYNGRAETLPPSTFDVVTMRAVERLNLALPIAAALLAPAGRLALLISSHQLDQVRRTVPTLQWDDPIPVPDSESRVLAFTQ